MSDHGITTLGVIGIGLIGSSLARAAGRAGVGSVVFHDVDRMAQDRAVALGLGEVAGSVREVCERADLIVLCAPPGVLVPLMRECLPHMASGSILSDVGSVKGVLVDAMREMPDSGCVVPGHPIAGSERSGPQAGRADLFEGRWCILTPVDSRAPAVDRLSEFWRGVGARVRIMEASRHDAIMSMTSHGPHLIAYNLVATAQRSSGIDLDDLINLSAGGFRDFTRIAASDPVMWRDVFLLNGDRVIEAIGEFRAGMDRLLAAIEAQDGATLEKTFALTRSVRAAIVRAGQETPAEDFGRRQVIGLSDKDKSSQTQK